MLYTVYLYQKFQEHFKRLIKIDCVTHLLRHETYAVSYYKYLCPGHMKYTLLACVTFLRGKGLQNIHILQQICMTCKIVTTLLVVIQLFLQSTKMTNYHTFYFVH